MSFRFALEKYIRSPEKYPSVVVFHDENVVIIDDAFPKSKIHMLVLPRDPKLTVLRPQDAFCKARMENIESMKEYIERGVSILQRRFRKEWKRVDGNDEDIGVLVCCHSVPSLNNLHIHVMSDDFCGDRIKNKKHYNSFTSEFAIKFDEFPLDETEDFRFDIGNRGACELLLKKDLVYNDVNYKGQFKKMHEQMIKDFDSIYRHV